MTQFSNVVMQCLVDSKAKGNQLTVLELEELFTDHRALQGKEALVKKTIAEVSEQFERRELQRQENRRICDIGADIDTAAHPISLDEAETSLVWIISGMRIGDLRDKSVFSKAERFAQYASSFTKRIDANGEEVTEPTLQCWFFSQDRRTAPAVTWRPDAPAFDHAPDGALSGGLTGAFNTWKGLPPYEVPFGWEELAAVWDEHLAYLIPDTKLLERFTQWLAHIVQKPGELPHTAWCFIAETHGIGRNWMASVLVRVLRGYVRSSLSLQQLFGKQFNGTVSQKLLAVVDEVHEGQARDRHTIAARLRSEITADQREINHKYGGNFVEYARLRWMFFSNYLDALPVGDKDRRIEFAENPKQCQSPLYYKRLFEALEDPLFIASVRHRLQTTDISGFDAGRHALETDFRSTAIKASQGELERHIVAYRDSWPGNYTTFGHLLRYLRAEMGDAELKAKIVAPVARQCGLYTTDIRIFPRGRDGSRESVVFDGRKMVEATLSGISKSTLVREFNEWEKTFDDSVYGSIETMLGDG